MGEGFSQLIFLAVILIASVFDAVGRNRKKQRRIEEMEREEAEGAAEGVGEAPSWEELSWEEARPAPQHQPQGGRPQGSQPQGAATPPPPPQPEQRQTADAMIPEDLWAILTGQPRPQTPPAPRAPAPAPVPPSQPGGGASSAPGPMAPPPPRRPEMAPRGGALPPLDPSRAPEGRSGKERHPMSDFRIESAEERGREPDESGPHAEEIPWRTDPSPSRMPSSGSPRTGSGAGSVRRSGTSSPSPYRLPGREPSREAPGWEGLGDISTGEISGEIGTMGVGGAGAARGSSIRIEELGFRDREALRRAIVLKEVLDPPVTLREEHRTQLGAASPVE